MREGEGREEGSDTFKALKTGCFTISVSSSFLSPFGAFSGEKREIGRAVYIWGEGGKERERKRIADCEIYTILDALEALYKRYSGMIKESLYKGLIGLNMRLYSSKGIGVRYIPYRVYR